MMIKEYNQLIEQKHMDNEKVKVQYVRKKKLNVTILPSDQSRVIEQAKFTYSPLGKGFEKQMKTR